ncbi:MAG: prenyltransferase [Candidatus Methanoperedens sp.]|nr:prenyltransferase [Candidatus Methanoperedens sp.]
MKFCTILEKFISFLISTSLFLAINGSFKIILSQLLLLNIFYLNVILITFLTIFSTYGLNKLTDLNEDEINNPKRAHTIKKIGVSFKFSVAMSFILSLILGFLENIMILPVILLPLFLGMLYSVKLNSDMPRLKDITGVKNISIALSWSVGTTFFPVIYLSEKEITSVILIFYLFFLKSFINSVMFDIRDIQGDRESNIRTIPIFLGKDNTKRLLLILNSTLIPWLIFTYYKGLFHRYFPILIGLILYGYWYILHFSRDSINKGKIMDLLIDGEFIIIAIFALAVYSIYP